MSHNADAFSGGRRAHPSGPQALGDTIAIHADGNGLLRPARAIRGRPAARRDPGRFFEEPCPFGPSRRHQGRRRRTRRADRRRGAGDEPEALPLDDRQPGRAGRPAGSPLQRRLHPHDSRRAHGRGGGPAHHAARTGQTGYVDTLHFVSCTPNAGPFQEYKGAVEKTGSLFDPPIRFVNGALRPPTGPGLGLAAGPDLLRGARRVGCP